MSGQEDGDRRSRHQAQVRHPSGDLARDAILAATLFAHRRRAIEHDPEFARAYVGLGDALRFQVPYSGLPAEDMFPRAENAINTALELDDQLGDAYAALGALKSQMGDVEAAVPALERALELDPNYAPAYIWYGINLTEQGRFEDAAEIYSKGLELDPLSITLHINAAAAAGSLGRFDEMRAQMRQRLILWGVVAGAGVVSVFVGLIAA